MMNVPFLGQSKAAEEVQPLVAGGLLGAVEVAELRAGRAIRVRRIESGHATRLV